MKESQVRELKEKIGVLKSLPSDELGKTASELLLQYRNELHNLESSVLLNEEHEADHNEIKKTETIKEENEKVSDWWSNWYTENSINLLLYVGAFLIIASASIFVGFQWGSISGTIKTLLLILVTVFFSGLGVLFYQNPRIKQAGIVFSSIGALLIPLCGIASYNFVFKYTDISGGWIWCATSVVSLLYYILLVRVLRSPFFTYISSISAASLALSLVNVFGLHRDYYIFAAIMSAMVILLGRLQLGREADHDEVIALPMEKASQVIMVIAALFGFSQGLAQNTLFTFQGCMSITLVTSYYAISYFSFRNLWQFALSIIGIPVSIIFFSQWLHFPSLLLIIILYGLSFIGMYFIHYLRQGKHIEEAGIVQTVSAILLAYIFIHSITTFSLWYKVLFGVLTAVELYGLFYITGSAYYILGATISITISLFLIHLTLFGKGKDYIVSFTYLVLAVIHYIFTVYFKTHKKMAEMLGLSCAFLFVVSYFASFVFPYQQLIIFITLVIVSFSASVRFSQKNLLYVSNIFIFASVLKILSILNLEFSMYPLVFTFIAYVMYGIGYLVPERFREEYKTSGYIAAIFIPFLFYIQGAGYGYDRQLTRMTLISGYAAAGLTGWEWYARKTLRSVYIFATSGIVMYLWQMNYLHFIETQIYTIPLAVYFMFLAYTRKKVKDESLQKLFNYIGLCILFFNLFFQVISGENLVYTLLMGVEGIILIGLGISWAYDLYKYAGTAAIGIAVLAQTYVYILMIPKWLLTGFVGMAFLFFAIYLLLKRQERK